MHVLKFNSEALYQLAKATAVNRIHGKPFEMPYTDETTEKMGFMLVKDDGIYVMNAFDVGAAENNIVAYAEGYDPNEGDCYDEAHYVSADDFADFLPLSGKAIQALALRKGYLEVGLTETELRVKIINH